MFALRNRDEIIIQGPFILEKEIMKFGLGNLSAEFVKVNKE